MAKMQIDSVAPHVMRGEFDRFSRVSPFEHAATAEPLPRTTHVGQNLNVVEVRVIKTRVSIDHSRVVVKTTQ